MTIYSSSYTKFAISRIGFGSLPNPPGDWTAFPRGPSSYLPTPMVESNQRIDGTQQIPIYWNIELGWQTIPQSTMKGILQLYDVQNQPVWLNYYGPTERSGVTWIFAPAVFAQPPQWRQSPRGILFYDVFCQFTQVEYYVPNTFISPGT